MPASALDLVFHDGGGIHWGVQSRFVFLSCGNTSWTASRSEEAQTQTNKRKTSAMINQNVHSRSAKPNISKVIFIHFDYASQLRSHHTVPCSLSLESTPLTSVLLWLRLKLINMSACVCLAFKLSFSNHEGPKPEGCNQSQDFGVRNYTGTTSVRVCVDIQYNKWFMMHLGFLKHLKRKKEAVSKVADQHTESVKSCLNFHYCAASNFKHVAYKKIITIVICNNLYSPLLLMEHFLRFLYSLHQGRDVFICVCLSVCLLVSKITQKLLDGLSQNLVERCGISQERVSAL